MKWHRFLVLAGLWIYAAFTLAEGLFYTVGGIFLFKDAYSFHWEHLVPLIFGLSMIVPAVLAVFTRSRLAKFRKTGVLLLQVLLGAQLLAGIYVEASHFINLDGFMVPLNLLRIIPTFVLLEANRFYFEKRKQKFL